MAQIVKWYFNLHPVSSYFFFLFIISAFDLYVYAYYINCLFLIVSVEMKPFRFDLFEDYLYIAMQHNNTLVRLDKFGFLSSSPLEAGLTRISDLVVFQENKQYVLGKSRKILAYA